ncbi:MaoC family dehydratase N-terminal domain-containing protein [Caballeronia sp. LZ029]|uniref:FAS1-like dehydratase domain-containing protein n=1 Tax=Caballeronia sp. LZ029 TaxID=3038564 RepID=UPI002856E267|nr:MaoC family dehydratase N-terminal domain-containing protein [Caballeronia sp. LZ029]MDR5748729.1 MaoC family dehydratase N-terminal domain-containing protein [Caballeronia sp. LZ029]
MPSTTDTFAQWRNKQESISEEISRYPITALSATLDIATVSSAVPPLWHWLYFLPTAPLAEVGADGHPKRGGFLPPVPLPRRMWAGGRLTFHGSLQPGEKAERASTITEIEHKSGRSGSLLFVTVRHEISVNGALKISEEQDIVYRDAPQPGAPAAQPTRAPDGDVWQRTVIADPVLLFRYSALTFNSHRIHYDHPYATGQEGYPGLVVHGPLIATLLADLVRRECPGATLRQFSFKAVRPTFAGQSFSLCAKPSDDGASIDLWAKDHEGYLTMRASALLTSN